MATYSTTQQPTWNDRPVQAWEGYPLRTDILERIDERAVDFGDRHCRFMVMRYDLRFPQGSQRQDGSQCLQKFINSFTAYFRTSGIDVHYVWVRESSSIGSHYHLLFFVDGRLTRRVEGHLREAERLWTSALGLQPSEGQGLVYHCQDTDPSYAVHNGEMIERGDTEKFNQVFYWISYLAKENTKDVGMPPWSKRFGCSRLMKQPSA